MGLPTQTHTNAFSSSIPPVPHEFLLQSSFASFRSDQFSSFYPTYTAYSNSSLPFLYFFFRSPFFYAFPLNFSARFSPTSFPFVLSLFDSLSVLLFFLSISLFLPICSIFVVCLLGRAMLSFSWRKPRTSSSPPLYRPFSCLLAFSGDQGEWRRRRKLTRFLSVFSSPSPLPVHSFILPLRSLSILRHRRSRRRARLPARFANGVAEYVPGET